MRSGHNRVNHKREVIVKVAANSTHDPEPQPRLALIQGLATGEKLDWSIEKAVEMGVDDLMICQTERSKVKITSDRALDKLVRWRAIVQSACSQSGRNWLPSVSYCQGLAAAFDWLQQRKGVALICQPGGTPSLKAFDEAFAAPNRVTIGAFVGPESGFSSTELELAKSKGAVAVTFSPFIMRTETAGPAILTLLDAKRNAQIQFC